MQRMWTLIGTLFLAGAVTLAQSGSMELSSLEQRLTDAQSAVSRASGLGASERSDLERELQDLEDDLAYLRVKQRKGERVTDRETRDLGERIDRFIQRTDDRSYNANTPSRGRVIPLNTELDVRLQTPLNSGKVKVEQRFEATTILDYTIGKDVVVPAGSTVRGFVSSVKAAGKVDRKGSLTLSFDELRIDTRSHRLRASVTEALDPKVHQIHNDEQLVLDLVRQEKILLVQGTAFNWPEPDHVRVVFLPQVDDLALAIERFGAFLGRYRQ